MRFALAALIAIAAALSSLSCGSAATGLRSVAPADAVIYLESPDIGALLGVLAENSGAARGPDSLDASILEGVEIAVAVTGFASSELPVTDSESVLNFQPQFILIADTHAWSWQVRPIVEGTLGKFVAASYGPGTKLETGVRDGIERYTWAAPDGRKAFAAVKGTLVFFSNTEKGVDSSLAVSEGKAPSLMGNERLSIRYANAAGKLAFGFVTKEGVEQLSGFAGISTAIDDSEGRGAAELSAVSGLVSKLIANSVDEIVWTAVPTEGEIEDVVDLRLTGKVAEAFSESMSPANAADDAVFGLVPGDAYSVTRYNLKNPRVAFRSLVLGAASAVDSEVAILVPLLGGSLLEPYGVAGPEEFLSFCAPFIVTVQFDEDGEKSAAIVKSSDFVSLRRTLSEELTEAAEGSGLELVSEDGGLAVGRREDHVVLGDPDSVRRCLAASTRDAAAPEGSRLTASPKFAFSRRPEHTSVTVRRESGEFASAASLFGSFDRSVERFSLTMTDFERSGVKRTYRSKLGFPGYLISLFSEGG